VRGEKAGVKEPIGSKQLDKTVKKPEAKLRPSPSLEKPTPIQLPPSFKDPIFGKVRTTELSTKKLPHKCL